MTDVKEVSDEIMDVAMESHVDYLDSVFPEANVNIGWAVDYIDGTIVSKVYGRGLIVTDVRTLKHTFEPFET